MAKRPAGKALDKNPLRPDFQIRDRDRENGADDGQDAIDAAAMRRAASGTLPTANMNNDTAAAPVPAAAPDLALAAHSDIVALLAQIGARLQQNERERLSMRQSLGDYKSLLDNLEDKTEQSEKIFLTLQDKLSKQESAEDALRLRQQDLENRHSDYAGRVDQAADRADAALADQARLNRRLDKITQDKHRFIRKLERIEETVVETQSALQQKAMVVLTDKDNNIASGAASPGLYTSSAPGRRIGLVPLLVACGVVAGLAFALGQAWSGLPRQTPEIYGPRLAASGATPVTAQTPAQLNARFDADPGALAKDLNAIAPNTGESVVDPGTDKPHVAVMPLAIETGFDPQGFLKTEASNGMVAAQAKPDPALPAALKPIETDARTGSVTAQTALASAYAAGDRGAKIDLPKAAQWFRLAALQGAADAQYNLGVLYAGGNGIGQDQAKALDWYRLAARQGQAGALYNLGVAHIEGRTAPYDPVLAAQYFSLAANGGLNDAAYNLAVLYEQGMTGKPNKLAALYWYNRAAGGGSAPGADAVKRLTADLRLTPAIVADAEAAAPALPVRVVSAAPLSGHALTARVQEQLIRLGLYPGPADGAGNPATRDAILTYQRLSRLTPDGQASQNLLTDMLQETPRDDDAVSPASALRPADLARPGGA